MGFGFGRTVRGSTVLKKLYNETAKPGIFHPPNSYRVYTI